MKLGKSIKKLTAMVMAIAMIFSVVGFCGNEITAEAASDKVKMYASEITFNKYGITTYNVYIQVQSNSASNKKVYVHHNTYDQGWVDTAATYVKKLDSNTEIWKATVTGVSSNITEYVIKYVGDGATYWDNNNGNNYIATNTLGTATVKAFPFRSSYNAYRFSVGVKNLAYNKNIQVRYTENNWATSKTATLSYARTIDGIDYFEGDIACSMSNVKFYVTYTVNGRTYIDNNFGSNYDNLFYRAY